MSEPILHIRFCDVGGLPVTLSVEEAAGVVGISRGLAYQLARSGRLPGTVRLGSRYRVGTAALLRAFGIEQERADED